MSRSVGVVTVQGLKSISTVVQMALFAMTLPRGVFDDYAVWFTGMMFVVGLGQAVSTERVIIGLRTFPAGVASAKVLALTVGCVQLAAAAALSSVPLAVASLAVIVYFAYDFQRLTRCFDEAVRFLRADLAALSVQCIAVLALWQLYGRSAWLVVAWWGIGALVWMWFVGRTGTLRDGLRVLRDDARDCLPLLVDSALAGVPLVLALTLANAQGEVGDASAARMAYTILGPVTVMSMSARRLIYQEVASGPLSRRFALIWSGLCALGFVVCVGLLSLTRTPLYPWAFPGFEGLTWVAIMGFAVGQTAVFATLLPAASLRADRRTIRIGAVRLVSTLVAVVAAWALIPFGDPADVAWSVAAGALAYAAGLGVARALTRPSAREGQVDA